VGRILHQILAGILGVLLGTVLALEHGHSAEATHRAAEILPGNGDLCAGWYQFPSYNPCWHDDEGGDYSALDLQYSSNNAGRSTYWRHWGADSSQTLSVSFASLQGTNCTGLRVIITTSGAPGDFHYLHIDPAAGVIGSTTQYWYSVPGYVEGYRYLGTTMYSQPTGCAFDVGGHLHQSGNNGSTSAIYTNWTVGTVEYCCDLWYWYSSTWTHKVIW